MQPLQLYPETRNGEGMSVFDDVPAGSRLVEDDHFFIIRDGYPVSPGHLLIVSKRPAVTFFDLNERERAALPAAIREAKRLIEEGTGQGHESRSHTGGDMDRISPNPASIPKPDGYNIGMNCGEAAGQTVMHFHCHVIPRYHGDTPNPRGGVRHCIPGRGDY